MRSEETMQTKMCDNSVYACIYTFFPCDKTGTNHDISCFSDFEHFVEMNILKPPNFGRLNHWKPFFHPMLHRVKKFQL